MNLCVRPLSNALGAAVEGVDLSRPIDDVTVTQIRAAWLEHLILLFPGQQAMTPAQQVAFSRRLGRLEIHGLTRYALPGQPEVYVVSNVEEDGKPIGAARSGRSWHTDMSYIACPPAGSMLCAREVPMAEGDTLFANLYAAYDALSAALKGRIDGRTVLHSRVKPYPEWFPERLPLSAAEKAALPDVVHPLVRTHPESGRRCLYLGGRPAWEVLGLPLDEGRALIAELIDFATQARFVYRHRWSAGDVILWDNRCAMHLATTFDEENERRIMHRTTITGDRPYAELEQGTMP